MFGKFQSLSVPSAGEEGIGTAPYCLKFQRQVWEFFIGP